MAIGLIDITKENACRTAEANAIRAKTGSTSQIDYDFENDKGFADAIDAIPAGKKGVEVIANGENNVAESVAAAETISAVLQTSPYSYYRLTITDFRRDSGEIPLGFASVAEFAIYDETGFNLADGAEYSASSYYNSTEAPAKAFDKDTSTMWQSDYSGHVSTTNWLQVHVVMPLTVKSFSITPRKNNYSDFAAAFTFSGSADGVNWTELYAASDLMTGWTRGAARIFELEQ